MQIANGLVTSSPEYTHAVQGITPAEALILKKMHNQYSNSAPLRDLVITGEATELDTFGKPATVTVKGKEVPSTKPRTDAEECARLRRKYVGYVEKKPAFEAVFGTASIIKLPATFEEIREVIGNVFTDPNAKTP